MVGVMAGIVYCMLLLPGVVSVVDDDPCFTQTYVVCAAYVSVVCDRCVPVCSAKVYCV